MQSNKQLQSLHKATKTHYQCAERGRKAYSCQIVTLRFKMTIACRS
jgi:hypothetical protein